MPDLTSDQENDLDTMFWNLIDRGATGRDAGDTIIQFVRALADARAEEENDE